MVLKVQYEPPSEEVLSRYYRELGVSPDSLARDVTSLQDWLLKQPHLPHDVDEKTLEKFLVHSKNSVERAKAKLEKYFSARATHTDMFKDRDPLQPAIRDIAQVTMYCTCPRTTPDGDRVTIVKTFDPEVRRFDLSTTVKVGLMLLDAHLDEDRCRKHIIIFDLQGNSLAHAATLTIPNIRKAHSLFLESLPQRFAGFHVVNAPSYFESIVTICKGLLSQKLAQRVWVHGKDMASLHSHISPDVLPPEYGGTYPASLDRLREMAYESLVERREWLLGAGSTAADVTKRPHRDNGVDSHKELEGSFRAINID